MSVHSSMIWISQIISNRQLRKELQDEAEYGNEYVHNKLKKIIPSCKQDTSEQCQKGHSCHQVYYETGDLIEF